jgi:pyruvate/2-oxoglutarate dehydrogenase complex dihydrolipoamide acyltransferase (E2) component
MALVPIILPQLGESIAEATVVSVAVKVGDTVETDQNVMEVETTKAATYVTAPARGIVRRVNAVPGNSYAVGSELAQIEVEDEVSEPASMPHFGVTQDAITTPMQPTRNASVEPTVRSLPVPAQASGASFMSPRMKARMQELGLHAADLAGVAGSGAGGRVTIQDFEKFLTNLEQHKTSKASTMRVAVADAMRRSWTRPLATVALPVNLDPLLAHRKKSDPKPGPALYALRALAIALSESSAPAGRLVGNKIVHPKAIDVGFAVEAEDGVLVPVLRNADTQPLKDLVARYNQLVELARQRRLPSDATGGSIATVTNFGTFGLTWATPIPLPEQTLVLGMGAGRRAPFWDEAKQQFVPIMECNLTLSFDHRVLDGGGAGRLLARISALMQKPEEL